MAEGQITRVHINKADGVKYAFATNAGRADIIFYEEEFKTAGGTSIELTQDHRSRAVQYDPAFGPVAKNVRLID